MRDTHSQALRIRRECANCIALCAVRTYVCVPRCACTSVCISLCVCVRFNNHCNCCWLAFFIICKPMYPAFYCQAAARPRPLQAQLQLNLHTHIPLYTLYSCIHLLMHAAPWSMLISFALEMRARTSWVGFSFLCFFLTGNARKLHFILGSTCVCVCEWQCRVCAYE